MANVRLIDRKSRVLTSSGLRCLSHIPTINMTAGCIHGCAYCYIRGYSQYPGDDSVVVYRNIAKQVQFELRRKRSKPSMVYFCPSSDAFMPIPEVLDQSYQTMRLLLHEGIGVRFVTKGLIPDSFLDLFAKYPNLVAGQIGLTSLDDHLNGVLEPNAATADQRLKNLERLINNGVSTSLRADPLILGLTDTDENLSGLFAETVRRGVRRVSASYLFLRPALIGSLKKHVNDAALLSRILDPFKQAQRLAIQGGSAGTALPVEVRQGGLHRVKRIAQEHGLQVQICGCKNPDLTAGRCHLTSLTTRGKVNAQPEVQPSLWEDRQAAHQ